MFPQRPAPLLDDSTLTASQALLITEFRGPGARPSGPVAASSLLARPYISMGRDIPQGPMVVHKGAGVQHLNAGVVLAIKRPHWCLGNRRLVHLPAS